MRNVGYAQLETLVGQELGTSPYQFIDQVRVQAFADATGDQQWIHVDVARSTRELGGPIVHGFLTLSLLPLLSGQIWRVSDASRVINYGSDKVRFTGMVPVGSAVRLRQRCLACDLKSGGKLLRLASAFELEGSERPVCVAETLLLALR